MEASNAQGLPCPRCGAPGGEGHRCAARPTDPADVGHSETLSVIVDPGALPVAAVDPMIGRKLGQNYRVLEPIGAGGMGVVYLVEHIALKKRFAAKVLTQELSRSPDSLRRFEVEAHSASRLEHDNIVNVIDYGRCDDGTLYLIMELLRGQTLRSRLNAGRLPLDEIVAVIVPVCRALGHAHEADIVHRDMKPDNVFLAQRGGGPPIVKVLDFGISKVRELGDGRITKQGQLLGSPDYMSPEAARGDEVDRRADIYAVGVMLYELFCGKPPFRHENYLKVLQMHSSHEPQPPCEVEPSLAPEIGAVIAKALSKRPEDRQQSMVELEAELLAALPDDAAAWITQSLRTPVGLWVGAPGPGPWTPSRSMAGMASGSLPAGARTLPADPSTLLTTAPRASGPRAKAIAAVIGGVAVIGAVLWWSGRRGPADADRDVARAPAPAPPATSAGAVGPATAPAVPAAAAAAGSPAGDADRAELVVLGVTTKPAGATARLGDRVLGTTPLIVRLPRDHAGELVIELPNHVTMRQPVALERDTNLDLDLVPVPRTRPRAQRPGAPRSADDLDIKETR